MNAASPGVIALFQPNHHYASHEAYLGALSEAMRAEYEAIVAAGYILQLDSPDLGLGRHMLFKDKPEDEYIALANLHVEVLNDALRNVPADKVRLHVCWGNYEGPHDLDVPLHEIWPDIARANVGAFLLSMANPRHAHEHRCFEQFHLPEDTLLVCGVVDTTTNYVEHPQTIADRIERVAGVIGDPKRIIAGTDCGFETAAGFGSVAEDVVWAKLRTLCEGAALASRRLYG